MYAGEMIAILLARSKTIESKDMLGLKLRISSFKGQSITQQKYNKHYTEFK